MTDFTNLLKEHTSQEDKRFESIDAQLATIRDNHLRHMETDIQALKMQGMSLTTDMSWVKWGVLAVLGALVAGSLGLIFVR